MLNIIGCAKDCVSHADPSPCKPNDTSCLCVNAKYSEEVGNCIQKKCSPEDAKAAAEVGIKYCKAVGIDPENPWPSCSINCQSEVPRGNCSDDKCLCKNKDFIEGYVWCLKKNCHGEDLKTSKCVAEAYCHAAGVDISSVFGY
ncbi:hypothetical protein M407DRAFT_30282 [Tulasnella calospora MUT 4182]|uniref:CFEM domain-containing protein n=1 Tax=Tulasnella calospora MUT 4182 TaxID=1051891 RepID=A0A0C3Q8H3_9AGAM|nr:hypothetical protein M407DRAFT_30282 [Tulasnella calospora MUT 4182]